MVVALFTLARWTAEQFREEFRKQSFRNRRAGLPARTSEDSCSLASTMEYRATLAELGFETKR